MVDFNFLEQFEGSVNSLHRCSIITSTLQFSLAEIVFQVAQHAYVGRFRHRGKRAGPLNCFIMNPTPSCVFLDEV